jgi:peptide deformylase
MGQTPNIGRARPIVRYGDPVLFQQCRPVRHFDESLRGLVDDMFASMYAADGIGLAANQIGVAAQVFVIDCPAGESGRLVGHVVNPALIDVWNKHDELTTESEGCLSLPGVHAQVPRLSRASVVGVDSTGVPVRLDGVGLVAQCLQHETDHLGGRLFVSRLPSRQRRLLLAEAGLS